MAGPEPSSSCPVSSAARSLRRCTTASDRDGDWCPHVAGSTCLTIVVAGASGDLARKKTYPALQFLFSKGLLPSNSAIIGYARSALTQGQLHDSLRPFLKGDDEECGAFLSLCSYVQGTYDTPEGFAALRRAVAERESKAFQCPSARLYYLALPPSVYPAVCERLRRDVDDRLPLPCAEDSDCWVRVIVEKPFGRDLASSEELAESLNKLYG
jgi:glucose-6-phosphate 1-dehydrogenase